MGPDRGKHLRNIAIVIALAVVVWQVPGGDSAGITISNILSLIFVGGLLFLGFRLYMENRETIFGLEERQRGVLYAGAALIAITLVGDAADVGRRRPRRDRLADDDRRGRVRHRRRLARVPRVRLS